MGFAALNPSHDARASRVHLVRKHATLAFRRGERSIVGIGKHENGVNVDA
jgi:hypothetical protein